MCAMPGTTNLFPPLQPSTCGEGRSAPEKTITIYV